MPLFKKNRKIIVILGVRIAFFIYFSGNMPKVSKKVVFARRESGHGFLLFVRQIEEFLSGKEGASVEFILAPENLDFEHKEGNLNFFWDGVFIAGVKPPEVYLEVRKIFEDSGRFFLRDVLANGLELWGLLRRGLASKKNVITWRDGKKKDDVASIIDSRVLPSLFCCYSDVYGLLLLGFNDEKLTFYKTVTEGFLEEFLRAKAAVMPNKIYAILPPDLCALLKDEEFFLINEEPLSAASNSVVKHKFAPAAEPGFARVGFVGVFGKKATLPFLFIFGIIAALLGFLAVRDIFELHGKIERFEAKKAEILEGFVDFSPKVEDAQGKRRVWSFYENLQKHEDARDIFLQIERILRRFSSIKVIDLQVNIGRDGSEEVVLLAEAGSLEIYDFLIALRAAGWPFVRFDLLKDEALPMGRQRPASRLVRVNISRVL